MHRTHTCGELRKEHAGSTVTIAGWVHALRPHGGVTFLDIRDRYGVTQAVVPAELQETLKGVLRESVLKITGEVKAKPKPNPNLKTGEIEVSATAVEVLGPAAPLPIAPEAENTDEARLKYRYLDLRRPVMQQKLMLRDVTVNSFRKHLRAEGFLDIETPLLLKSTPEGARDYVVPSRVHHGKFYALPQSPQIYKQLLMVSGFDRYFQVARCLRDEDLRADRQPEFTQIDLEMSFVEPEDVYALGEKVCRAVLKDTINYELKEFPRVPYAECMEKYGCDKPDLRFGLELSDVTEIGKRSEFSIFKEAKLIKCICAPKTFGRKEVDAYTAFVKDFGAKGLAFANVKSNTLDGGIAKFFPAELQKELIEKTQAKDGETLLFVADAPKIVNDSLAKLRVQLGKDLELYSSRDFSLLWVTDFPLFEWDEDNNDWTPAHHMFTMPKPDSLQYLDTDPGKVVAQCYDLVMNGVERASGSLRVHHPEIQRKIMRAMHISEEEAKLKFGFMLEAFTYGAPPHGGFAIGLDRFCAMLNGEYDIREFIAFPKNKSAECPMDGSPTPVDEKQLKDLGLILVKDIIDD